MKRVKHHAAIIGGSPDDIEHSFYEALNNADIAQLMSCWADEDEVVCVHPGGPRLIGQAAIRASFETLFANGNILATPQRVQKVVSLACALHHMVERVEVKTPQGSSLAHVIVTNVYQKTPQGWRMVAHHASPGTPHDMGDAGAQAPMLH